MQLKSAPFHRTWRARALLAAGALALGGASLAAGADAPPTWEKDPSTGCSFVAPSSLAGSPIHWIGACPAGKATGLGMLRSRAGAKAGIAFYGEMRDGVPVQGAIDFDGGYQVGRFAAGDIGTGEVAWQDRHDGFEVAVRAARAVSQHYTQNKNPASARHYSQVARTLDRQLDGD